MKCQSCLARIDSGDLCAGCASARLFPERLEYRRTGRTSRAALRAVLAASQEPGTPFPALDHYTGPAGARVLEQAIRDIALAIGFPIKTMWGKSPSGNFQVVVVADVERIAKDRAVMLEHFKPKLPKKGAVANLRERVMELKKTIKPSKELIEAVNKLNKKRKKKCARSAKK